MLPAILKLLRLRVRLAWNTFKHRRLGQKIAYIVAGFGLMVFAGFLVFVSWGILHIFNDPTLQQELSKLGMGELFLNLTFQLPVLFCLAAFVVGLFANFGVLLSGLYLSGDMEFLLTAPLPARAVFLSKLLQAILPNLLLLALISGPALFGLGIAQHYSFLYYLLVPIILSMLVTLGAGLSSILVMLVVRVVNPRRAAEVLGLVGGLTAFICSQSGQLAGSFSNVDIPTEQLAGVVNTLGRLASPLNPLAWPGLGLTHIGQGNWLQGLGFTGLTLGVTVVLFAVTLTFAERMYFSGWSRVQHGTKKNKRRHKRETATLAKGAPRATTAPRVGTVFSRVFPAPTWAIVLKDARLYRRDIRNLSNLIFPIILAVIWTISLFRGGSDLPSTAQNFFDSSSLGIGLFMAMMFVMRFGFGGFSLEGQQWWILKTSPVRPFHLVLAKYIVAIVPPSVFGVLYLVIASFLRKITVLLLLYQIVAELIVVAGLAALTLAFGIWGARFNWTNPNQVSGGAVGCIGSFLTFGFIALAGGIFLGLPILADSFEIPVIFAYAGALIIGVIVSALGGGVPLIIASGRILHLGEVEQEGKKATKKKARKGSS